MKIIRITKTNRKIKTNFNIKTINKLNNNN